MNGLKPLRQAIEQASDPQVMMCRVVEQALALIPASDGAVLALLHDDHLAYVCAAGTLRTHLGIRLWLDDSLSGLAVRTGETLCCEDCAGDPRASRSAYEQEGAASLICVPLARGGEPLGVLKVTASQPRAFDDEDVAALARLAGFISTAIGAMSELAVAAGALLCEPDDPGPPQPPRGGVRGRGLGEFVANVLAPGVVGELALRERIERIITHARVRMVLQPIVELSTGRLLGAEALARFPGPPRQAPDEWFADAGRIGLRVALELAAVSSALDTLRTLAPEALLAVNLSAEALAAPELADLLDHHQPGQLVIELTEHLRVTDYPQVRSALSALRRHGVRLAIDDTGAGFAGLAHILELAPDLIKLDRRFSSGIDTDPARRAVAQSLVSLARETGATMIAEGIETPGELQTIRELGISYGQGYLICRPRAARSLPHAYPHLIHLRDAPGASAQ